MSSPVFYPRSVERRLVEALEDSPVVLIHGPRQCGKTTLAQFTCAPNYLTWGDDHHLIWGGGDRLAWGYSREDRDYRCFSFDDPVTRDGAWPMRDHALTVTGATVTSAARVDSRDDL